MEHFYTKETLYNTIHNYKNYLGFDINDVGIDMIKRCNDIGITIEKVPFKTKGLRGMAIIGDNRDEDVILLNSNRGKIEQNFDCGHEVVHLGIHREIGPTSFNCIDKIYAKQDEYIEWQANEGAAELFVPYTALLPFIKFKYHTLTSSSAIQQLKSELGLIFNVSSKVIEFRFESLKYEISQYLCGVSIDDIKILSNTQQGKSSIYIKSINDRENEFIEEEKKTRKNHEFINFNVPLFDMF